MQYESTFNAIDNILCNEAGCSTELDYIEQTSWLLFLKYLEDLEAEREMKGEMSGKPYKRIITGFLRWSQRAAPKKPNGTPDDINCMTGPDLQQFVDTRLFPELRSSAVEILESYVSLNDEAKNIMDNLIKIV
jgi:type I restriction enzyme M protein